MFLKNEVIKFIDLVFGKLKNSKDLPTLKKFSSLAVGEKIYFDLGRGGCVDYSFENISQLQDTNFKQ